MRSTLSLLATWAAYATALPGMQGFTEEMKANMRREASAEPSLLKNNPITALTNTIDGLLGSVFEGELNPDDLRPEPGYEFIAPGPNDSRGPCPGLNTLANHGYLPRNGYVSAGEVLEAVERGFNMFQDLATVLIVFAILSDGSFKDESFWLGTDPVTGIGGLNRHSTVEADISPNREDFYNACGDNHHLSSRLFRDNVNIVGASASKQFDIPNMAKHYAAIAEFAETNNPTLYYQPFPMIVSVVAFNFYPRYFANGTNELGGPANYESISSIIGAKYNKKTGEFEYVPERFPENWYRRSTPYGVTRALTEGYTMIYPAHPVLPPGFDNFPLDKHFTVENIFCEVYYGLNSLTPLALAGEEAEAGAAFAWAVSKLEKSFNMDVFGCKKGSYSKNVFYPNGTQNGGPLNPGKFIQKNAGNNVYNKVYHPTAPVTPNCNN